MDQIKTPATEKQGFLTGLTECIVSLLLILICMPLLSLAWVFLQSLVCSNPSDLLKTCFPPQALTWAQNSLLLGAGTAFVALLPGVPIGIALARSTWGLQRYPWLLLLLLLATPLYVVTTGWTSFFGLDRLVAASPLWQTGWGALVQGIAICPLVSFVVAGGASQIPMQLEESALLDTGPVGAVLHILLPACMPAIAVAAAAAFCFGAMEMTVSDAIALRTYAEHIYRSFQTSFDAGATLLRALPFLAVLAAITAVLVPPMLRLANCPLFRTEAFANRRSLRPLGWLPQLALTCLLGLFMLPLLQLAYTALQESNQPLTSLALFFIALRSALFAATGALLSLLSGVLIAAFLRTHPRFAKLGALFVSLFYVLPPSLLAIAVYRTWNNAFLEYLCRGLPMLPGHTVLPLLLYYAARGLPFATLLSYAAFHAIPEDHLDQGRLAGCGFLQSICKILLPLSIPHVLVAFVYVYVLSMSDVAGAMLVAPPGLGLIAFRFATQIHFGVYPDLARLVFTPLFFALLPMIPVAWSLIPHATNPKQAGFD